MQVESYELGQYVKVIDDILSEKHLNMFFDKVVREIPFVDATVGAEGVTDKKIRNTLDYTLTKYDKNITTVHWCNFICYKVNAAIQNHYKPLVPHLTYNFPNAVQVLKYEEGGFYTPHVDHFHGIPRTLSIVMFLNDDYEGGDFEMFSPDGLKSAKVKPKKGRTIIFPSNFQYPHRANKVLKGTRYALVMWVL